MIANFIKHMIRCALMLSILSLLPHSAIAADFIGAPADPFDPTPENCGKPVHTPALDHANQMKAALGESIQPHTSSMFSKLGYAYLKGCGAIKQDFEEAKYWLEFAVKCEYLDREAASELYKAYDAIIKTLVGMITHSETWVLPGK
jgi:hypothetical protein